MCRAALTTWSGTIEVDTVVTTVRRIKTRIIIYISIAIAVVDFLIGIVFLVTIHLVAIGVLGTALTLLTLVCFITLRFLLVGSSTDGCSYGSTASHANNLSDITASPAS